jgi:hypothetical protein
MAVEKVLLEFQTAETHFDEIIDVLDSYAITYSVHFTLTPAMVLPGRRSSVVVEWLDGPYDPRRLINYVSKSILSREFTGARCIEDGSWKTIII